MKLSDREIELLRGMLEVQQKHKDRSDIMSNQRGSNPMFKKQSEWDQERIDLLNKLIANG